MRKIGLVTSEKKDAGLRKAAQIAGELLALGAEVFCEEEAKSLAALGVRPFSDEVLSEEGAEEGAALETSVPSELLGLAVSASWACGPVPP